MTALYSIRRYIILFLVVFMVSVPFAYGAINGNGAGDSTVGGNGAGSPPVSGNGSGAQPGQKTELINPLKAKSISEFLVAIVDVLLIFATPLIVIYIMYAGFKFVTAQGNPSEIESARTALLWAVVGGVIVLGAKLILEVIQGTIEAFNTTP